ncbi:hypothetical protein SUDANB37_03025 [Streptomyces sp. enrichment culture]
MGEPTAHDRTTTSRTTPRASQAPRGTEATQATLAGGTR